MKWIWIAVVVCLLIALLSEGLIRAISEACGFALALFAVFKVDSPKKASLKMTSRIKPSQYDKVL